MSAPFQPKGELPEWEMLFNLLASKDIGDTATYAELDELLDRDFRSNRGPIDKAITELLETHQRGVIVVRNVGYRIVPTAEHERVVLTHHKKATRQLVRSKTWADNTKRNELEPAQASRMDRLSAQFGQLNDVLRRQERKMQRQELVTQFLMTSDAQQSERINRLEDLLTRHGITDPPVVDVEADEEQTDEC